MGYDRTNIQIQRKRIISSESTPFHKNRSRHPIKEVLNSTQFCYKMYEDWTYKDTPIDLPILIIDNEAIQKNKDIYTIPRLHAKYASKKIQFPFVYHEVDSKYEILNTYFRIYINKEVPSCEDFKKIVIEKRQMNEYQNFFESINLFLYTSFLLRQFASVMNIIPNFYSPISDETKYYFYMCVDFLRRKSIEKSEPFMKSQLIDMIRILGKMDGLILEKTTFQKYFLFLDDSFFTTTYSIFIQKDTPFSFMVKDEIKSNEIK